MNTYQKIQWLAWMITGLSIMGIAMCMLTGSQVGPVLAVSHIAMSLMLAVPNHTLILVCVAVILLTTVYSGIEYFIQNKDVLMNGEL